jgi:hypothetical protein
MGGGERNEDPKNLNERKGNKREKVRKIRKLYDINQLRLIP